MPNCLFEKCSFQEVLSYNPKMLLIIAEESADNQENKHEQELPTERPIEQSEFQVEGQTEQPDFQEEGQTEQPDFQEEGQIEQPDFQEEGQTEQPEFQEEGQTEQPEFQEEGQTEQPEFQEEGQIDVKPFLDGSDGGYLTPPNPDQMILLWYIIPGILVIWIIANSFLVLFSSFTPKQDNCPEPQEVDDDQHSNYQDTSHDIRGEFSNIDSDDYSYLTTSEKPPVNPNNDSKNTSDDVRKGNLEIQDIFDSNTIKSKKNRYDDSN